MMVYESSLVSAKVHAVSAPIGGLVVPTGRVANAASKFGRSATRPPA